MRCATPTRRRKRTGVGFREGRSSAGTSPATLRQSFDYQYFPFERENVWLRLWPRDFDRQVLLVP
jgi:hypothetical protein